MNKYMLLMKLKMSVWWSCYDKLDRMLIKYEDTLDGFKMNNW